VNVEDIPGIIIEPFRADRETLLGLVVPGHCDEAFARTMLSHFSLGTLTARVKSKRTRRGRIICGLPGQFWCWLEDHHFALGFAWFGLFMRYRYELEKVEIIFLSREPEKISYAFLFFAVLGIATTGSIRSVAKREWIWPRFGQLAR